MESVRRACGKHAGCRVEQPPSPLSSASAGKALPGRVQLDSNTCHHAACLARQSRRAAQKTKTTSSFSAFRGRNNTLALEKTLVSLQTVIPEQGSLPSSLLLLTKPIKSCIFIALLPSVRLQGVSPAFLLSGGDGSIEVAL